MVGAEQVGNHGKGGAFDIGKEQGRAAPGNYPAMYLGYLQIGINLGVDNQEFIFPAQDSQILAQVTDWFHKGCGGCREKRYQYSSSPDQSLFEAIVPGRGPAGLQMTELAGVLEQAYGRLSGRARRKAQTLWGVWTFAKQQSVMMIRISKEKFMVFAFLEVVTQHRG